MFVTIKMCLSQRSMFLFVKNLVSILIVILADTGAVGSEHDEL